MRYRVGEDIHDLGPPVVDGMLMVTAVIGLLIGIGFVIAGMRGKQRWLAIWGGGLVIVSLIYISASFLGYA